MIRPAIQPAHPTTPLIHALVPLRHRGLRTLVQMVLGVAFLALLAQLRLEIGAVPITGQTLGVLLLAAAAGLRLGGAITTAYLVVGAAGLPVFTGGGAGLSHLSGTTAGYLVGFVLAALLVGALAERGWAASWWKAGAAMLLGNLVILACGLAWLSNFAPDFATTLAWGFWPFLPGDLIKLALATALLPLASRWLAPGEPPTR